ncbi:HAD-IIB family hydrolase [Caldithrix abyssi]
MKNNWLIFTDLDGTLLDFDTYDFSDAVPALRLLKNKGIPVIPCTSKTFSEVLELRKRLGISDPFIVENGSAIFFERNYFKNIQSSDEIEGFPVIVLGKARNEILAFFKTLQARFSLNIKGFSEMTISEIQKHTGLKKAEAELAQNRMFSEPMVSFEKNDLSEMDGLLDFIQENGFRLLKGNRFYHLIGRCDKGLATQKLVQLFEDEYGKTFKTMGLGDSKNDLEMLAAVHQPIIIRKKDGSFVHLNAIDNVYITNEAGPAGWAEAIYKFVGK